MFSSLIEGCYGMKPTKIEDTYADLHRGFFYRNIFNLPAIQMYPAHLM